MTALKDEIAPWAIQGSLEWLALRKTKITATDASAIMGANKWKTVLQLYHEKLSNDPPMTPNAAMQRGLDLEPVAREQFNSVTTYNMQPAVIVKDWAMASLDGLDAHTGHILEIKCPGTKDHDVALSGKVPDHYYPQLQHQMWVANVNSMYYLSFDGDDGIVVDVFRNNEYIGKMIEAEWKFYQCLQDKIPPEVSDNNHVQRNDSLWLHCAAKWKSVSKQIKDLEREEEELRNQLIFLSNEQNSTGAGVSLSQMTRKGNVDYSKIEELKNIDLEKYRKGSTTSWRITTI